MADHRAKCQNPAGWSIIETPKNERESWMTHPYDVLIVLIHDHVLDSRSKGSLGFPCISESGKLIYSAG